MYRRRASRTNSLMPRPSSSFTRCASSLRKFFADAGASRTENLSEAKLFPLIDALTVRRDRGFIKERYRNERFIDGTPVRFPEPELHERRYDLDSAHPGIVQAIYDGIDGLTMARYRLSAYRIDRQEESASEEALAGLIQSQLLKRFEVVVASITIRGFGAGQGIIPRVRGNPVFLPEQLSNGATAS